MEIRQQKNSNKIHFAFGEQALGRGLEVNCGTRSYFVPYAAAALDR